ncbi:MAG: ribosome-associated translation inhibitor RaiA [Anaerolineales bacterium]|nr:ribosome-associated translation inhibitor RaiA [Chloroflexota bacterium]MBL6983088.1 ribosome-associated translation inhibitor RaiA [Anaerolineales bacterium]
MAMEVKLFVRDLKLTEKLHDYVENKVSKLDRYINNINEARVDLAHVKSARDANDRYVAQVTIRGKGFILRAEERSDDIVTAIDAALPKIQRRIERYKGKHHIHRGDGVSAADATMEFSEDMDGVADVDTDPEIVRRKHFILTPMDEMEAIEQMELLGHEDFFLFLNAHSGQINVLYKRRDGKYGVIEPEIA